MSKSAREQEKWKYSGTSRVERSVWYKSHFMNLNLIQSLYLGTLHLLIESHLKDHIQAHYSMFCHIVVNGGFFFGLLLKS